MSETGYLTFAVTASGDPGIDGLLGDRAWADARITYALPKRKPEYGDYGGGEDEGLFRATPAIRAAADFALNVSAGDPAQAGFAVEGFTGLGLSFTARAGATIRIAQTTKDPYDYDTAWTYPPSAAKPSGDIWFTNEVYDYSAPQAGNYAYLIVLHELGHALGLRHGHETEAFGALPAARDAMEYSVMTFRSFVGAPATGYLNEAFGYAQSWMMQDIAALQYLYGADFSTNAGDTVYAWKPDAGITYVDGVEAISPGANRIFATIWDGGGSDIYDLSAYRDGVSVDLRPGAASAFDPAQLAGLGAGNLAAGNIYNALLYEGDSRSLIEDATGGAGADLLRGNQTGNALRGRGGDDRLAGAAGADMLFGGGGDDTIRGGRGNDRLAGGPGTDILTGGAGADLLRGGGGADLFRFVSAGDSPAAGAGDRIADFTTGSDRIDLSRLDAPPLALMPGGRFSGTAPGVVIAETADDTLIRIDADADAIADMEILLVGARGLGADDFLL